MEEGIVNIYRETVEQYMAILDVLKKKSSMAIQDDYELWNQVNKREAGKLLFVDQADYATQ
jgi:predicted GTPase